MFNKLFINVFFLVTLCGSNSRMAPAAGAGTEDELHTVYAPGTTWTYELTTAVLLNEPAAIDKDVGFQVLADVKVDSIWRNRINLSDRLFKIQLISPKLYIKSRKSPAPESFIKHISPLEELSNSPFLVHWNNGKVQSIFVPKEESLSLINLKKGIASLFQLLDVQVNETDSSGHCTVSYTSTSPISFTKSKVYCSSEDTPYLYHPEKLFSVNVKSNREANYVMSNDNAFIQSIKAWESHEIAITMKPDAGSQIKITQGLKFKESSTTNVYNEEAINDVMTQLTNEIDSQFSHETLTTEREPRSCGEDSCPTFASVISENVKNLESKYYGTLKGANAFLKTINLARQTYKDDLVKVLKKKQNKPALLAIYDILGSAQTLEAHQAAMKQLRFTDEKHLNRLERYLWALSMGSHPKHDIILDLLHRYQRSSDLTEKLEETLVSALATMTNKYIKNPNNLDKNKIYQNVKEVIYNGIENCNNKSCQFAFIRALKNLNSVDTIPKLLELALNSSDKSSVVAMKALRALPPNSWNKDVISICKKIFLQLKKKYDSSARALAVEIILSSNPTEEMLEDILMYLLSNDKAYEIKKYVLQKIFMLSEKNCDFKVKVQNIIRRHRKINNYSVLSQKGLSTALSRPFLQNRAVNGSMISVQEMSSGLVKRGVFDVVLEENGQSHEMFSLGLFSGGLSSFISSDEEESKNEDVATAGMELTMLGTQIRPFVFFTGQGELMGHVWSGTASESTPAFQINTLIHDHLEYLRLSPGFIAEFNLQTGVSFNLAGEIQISLWNRNSHSLVTQNAAIITNGVLHLDTNFVQSKVKFIASMEPKLNLESDIEFASNVAVCLRLTQPSFLFKHNIFKEERIPGSKHRIRKVKYKKFEVPGRTYNLNKKTNDMCNVLMKSR